MKKIRLADGTEYEIYDISDGSGTLKIAMLDADASAMEQVFRNAENLSIIQYYVGIDLMKAYARYTKLARYEKKMGQLIGIDYTTPDETTESGFAETCSDILILYLDRTAQTSETESLTARVEDLEADVTNINNILESGTETEEESDGETAE